MSGSHVPQARLQAESLTLRYDARLVPQDLSLTVPDGSFTVIAGLNASGRTIVAVLHDLNHACRYASHLITMKDGAIVRAGAPAAIVTEEQVEEVFGLPSLIISDPVSGTPLIVPKGHR
ncbi:hypothetical protein [Pannonibacter phragmitetus]|uniref:hypothetical protein n=1 Tax=Pannonibacter phragmitetus TaxID=121719 RepID=UPI003D2F0676